MEIRKQIRDYAFTSIQSFADSYLKTKNYIFNTDSQLLHKNQFVTTNTSRRSNLNNDSSSSKYRGTSKDKNEPRIITSIIKNTSNSNYEEKDLVDLSPFIFENRLFIK